MRAIAAAAALLTLVSSAALAALKPGDAAPDFSLEAAQGGKEFLAAAGAREGSGRAVFLSEVAHERLHDGGA
jgi:hypothetical protein